MPSPLLVATSISASLAMGLVSVFFQSVQDHLRERLQVSEDRLAQLRWPPEPRNQDSPTTSRQWKMSSS